MKVLLLLLCLSVSSFGVMTPTREISKVEDEVLEGRLPKVMLRGLSAAIITGSYELKKRGYVEYADKMEREWFDRLQHDWLAYAMGSRDIGDHDPLWAKLAEWYMYIEAIIGLPACERFHITALKIFNFTPKVIFRPASFPMDNVVGERIDEYRKHFAKGAVYYGGFSEAVFWGAYLTCTFGSAGTGWVLICGTLGNLAEKGAANFVGPRLSDWIFNKANGKTEAYIVD